MANSRCFIARRPQRADMYLVLMYFRRQEPTPAPADQHRAWKIEGAPMTYFSVTGTDFGYVAAWRPKIRSISRGFDRTEPSLLPERFISREAMHAHGNSGLGAKDGTSLVAWKKNDVLGGNFMTARTGSRSPESASIPARACRSCVKQRKIPPVSLNPALARRFCRPRQRSPNSADCSRNRSV